MAAESTVRILFLGDSAQAVRSVSKLESSFAGLGRTTKLVAGGLAIGLVGALVESTKQAMAFQRSMELIHTQAGASTGEVKKMSGALLDMAKSVGTTPEDLAKGLYHIESAGLRGSAALKALRAAAEGAQVGQADLESVTNALVAAQKSGVKGAGSMEHAMATLNAIVGAGNMRMEDLTSVMGNVLPAAGTFGVSLQQVGAALATMTVQGVKTDEAATRLRMTMSLLAAPSSKAAAALKGIGLNSTDLANAMRGPGGLLAALTLLHDHLVGSGKDATQQAQIISAAFGGGRTSSGIMLLTQHISDMQDRLRQINGTTGNFGEAWKKTTQTVDFQLAQAKAALEAAAIPIGNLLLPLLIKAANAAEGFATKIESDMPQITRDFQTLGGVLGVVGNALEQLTTFAFSPVGSATLIGVLSGVGARKAIGGLAGLAVKAGEASTALTGVGVAGLALADAAVPLAAGVGVSVAAIYALSQASDVGAQQTRELVDALQNLTDVSATAGQASRNLAQSHLNVRTTAIAVTDAERAYSKAVHDSGKDSEEARKAELALRQARLNHRQALADEESAQKSNTAAKKAEAKQIQETQGKLADLNRQFQFARSMVNANTDALTRSSAQYHEAQREGDIFAQKMDEVARNAERAAHAIPSTQHAAQLAAQELAHAAAAAAELERELGRIPSRKEIRVYYKTINEGPGGNRFIGRASGGFVPMVPGASKGSDSVPAMLTPGEIVLNRAQQNVLGGPRFLAGLFGFTGGEGPGFATGGIANKPRRTPHRSPRPRYRTLSRKAKAALKGVDAINQQEDDSDRAYGQLVRQYQIADTDLQFIRTDDAGNQYISQTDIAQRVGEIDSLIVARSQMLDLLAEEKRKLRDAIEALHKAIQAMVKRIQEERKKIEQLTKRLSAEHRKKKPDQGIISSLQNQISARGTAIGNLHSTISEFQRAVGDQRLNLEHQLPFDVRDVQLDIMELQQERKDDTGTTLPPSSGGSGGSTSGPDVSALEAEIARLQLALGLQAAQSAVIGAFAKGTLSVPETGLAMVHAGEQIVPAGQVRGGDGGTYGPIQVNLSLSGPLEPLAQFVTATVDTPQMVDRISVRIGQRSMERARSGRH